MGKKISKINLILINAFLVRIIVLICIVVLADMLPAYGLRGNFVEADDYRYEQGAVEYAHSAEGLIDVETFTEIFDSMGDHTGHHLFSLPEFISWSPLWYWIVCILVYITKWRWSIRILNILLVTFSVKFVYKLTQYVYGEKTALLAANLMAYLPYIVLFSCFSYKDCLIMFCTFFLWYFFVKRKYEGSNTWQDYSGVVICTVLLFLTRSGLSFILLGILLVYYYFDKICDVIKDGIRGLKENRRFNKKLVGLAVIFVLVCVLVVLYRAPLMRKFAAYITNDNNFEGLGFGALAKIRSFKDIWKLPLTLTLAILQPIGFDGGIASWGNLISVVNIVMCPVAVGCLLYIIRRDKPDRPCFWFMMLYYMISAVPSVLIFRHLFSVLPIPLIACSDFLSRASAKQRKWWMALSGCLMLAVAAVFVFT